MDCLEEVANSKLSQHLYSAVQAHYKLHRKVSSEEVQELLINQQQLVEDYLVKRNRQEALDCLEEVVNPLQLWVDFLEVLNQQVQQEGVYLDNQELKEGIQVVV